MLKKYLLLVLIQSVVFVASAQEFWTGSKGTGSTISRTGATKIGSLNFRSSGTSTTSVLEHTALTGDLYIRSVASASNEDVGNLLLNDVGGNVGIGTPNPRALLHLAQASVANVPRAPIIFSRYWLDDDNTRASSIFHFDDGTKDKLVFAVSGLGGSYTNPANISQAKMVIQANGNVGIGTTTPNSKLSVNGNVQFWEVKVTTATADWPDYVFDSSYQLPSLETVASQIKKSGHLPDMPSAAEVCEQGLDVGHLLNLQQKKIEELTLYMIAQQKEIKALREQFKQLQNGEKDETK